MFPLPLSDFEYYMLVDDRPSHPMVFVMTAQRTDTTAISVADSRRFLNEFVADLEQVAADK